MSAHYYEEDEHEGMVDAMERVVASMTREPVLVWRTSGYAGITSTWVAGSGGVTATGRGINALPALVALADCVADRQVVR